jgi:hypothetical protein
LPEEPELEISKMCVDAFRYDDFMLVIIWGQLRVGKSAYSMHLLGEVYDYFFGKRLDVSLIKSYMGFHPRDVIDSWLQIDKRIPMYIWDDAGYWLFSMDWHDPLLKAIQKYFNVIGTDMNVIVMTTPDPRWILSKLVQMPGAYRGLVSFRDGLLPWGHPNRDSPSRLWSRKCRGYKNLIWPDLKKTVPKPIWEDEFYCHIPDKVYDYYKPMRDHYADLAKGNIAKVLTKAISKDKSHIAYDVEYLAERAENR